MKSTDSYSYDILPVSAVINGALLVCDSGRMRRQKDPKEYWVRQSPPSIIITWHSVAKDHLWTERVNCIVTDLPDNRASPNNRNHTCPQIVLALASTSVI